MEKNYGGDNVLSKDENLKYIKGFSKISVKGICEELNIDRANVLRGKASSKNIEAVKEKIEEKLKELE